MILVMEVVKEYRVVSEGDEPDETFPYTLRGIEEAISRAKFASMGSSPRKVMTGQRVIRRYENGRETRLLGALHGPVTSSQSSTTITLRPNTRPPLSRT